MISTLTKLISDLNMYDRRFLPLRPQAVRTLVGNVNTCSRNLGLDVLETQILAAAGEDKRVRLWSLDTGKLVESSGAGVNLPDKVFERPVNAMTFQTRNGRDRSLWVADGSMLHRYDA